MTLEPILSGGSFIHVHLAAALGALAAGTWMIVAPKGTAVHRAVGRAFMLLMLLAAVSTVGITSLNNGKFSFIHLLSIFVLVMVPYGWFMARRGNILAHRMTMIGLYVGGLWIPGALAFLPGRVLHQAVFG
jgi:uncharacterized membrane protein